MDWLINALRATWLLLANVPVTIRDQKTADAGGAFLRGLVTREAMFDAHLPGTGRTDFTGDRKQRLIQQEPQISWRGVHGLAEHHGSSAAL